MLSAGLYAVMFPAQALAVLVMAGGALLLIDGVLGLWSLTFGGGEDRQFLVRRGAQHPRDHHSAC